MGKERHERTGADRPSVWGTLLFMESRPLNVFGGLRLGYPLLQGKEGKGSGETTPPWSPPPTPWGGGSSYHWQGAWGGGCQSPHLPDWSWSCHLICCVGREANRSSEQRGGCEGGGILFSHTLPCPQDAPAPLVMPQAALCPQDNGSTLEI